MEAHELVQEPVGKRDLVFAERKPVELVPAQP